MRRLGHVLLGLLAIGLAEPDETVVHNAAEFAKAVEQARGGDTIVLADGIWHDATLTFDADGALGDTITVQAETPGGVILTGSSRLRIGGSYLKVEGLWFHRGALSGGHVIAFRTDRHAHHSRLTACAVTEYNPSNWLVQYKWVSMYGTHNRVDHSYFAGKTHDGATLVVWLEDAPDHVRNHHRIDHNHFGPRPRLGKNGGETIRIGTSHRSMQSSHTIVENNLFERTDGEHEIISNKTGHNVFRGNTFWEAQGALTLRHGNAATVTGNYFLGRRRPGTGGVRIIGEDHRVADNYFEGLRGDSSRASLSIMNGIPNSPLNRYFQVKRAEVAHNTWVDTRVSLLYGLGADSEKSLRPEGVTIRDNVIVAQADMPVIRSMVPFDGVVFDGNVFHGLPPAKGPPGIAWQDPTLQQGDDGLWRPSPDGPAHLKGARLGHPPVTESDVGPPWWGMPWTPTILADSTVSLPDFSWAGYRWGEQPIPELPVTMDVTAFGATGDDMRDDTAPFQRALAAAHQHPGPVVLGIPAGRFHLSGILRLERDSLVLRGRGPDSTFLVVEKPLRILDTPAQQQEEVAGAPSSQGLGLSPFAYQGGIIWVRSPSGIHAQDSISVLSAQGQTITVAERGAWTLPADAQLRWTTQGRRHAQVVTVIAQQGLVWRTKEPLWEQHITGAMDAHISAINLLREVGVEHLSVVFEPVPYRGHQLDDDYNAVFFDGVRHGWIRDVTISNADNGVLLRASANVTMAGLVVRGRGGHSGVLFMDTRYGLLAESHLSQAVHPVGCVQGGGYNVVLGGSAASLYEAGCIMPNLYDGSTLESAGDVLWQLSPASRPVLWNVTARYEHPDHVRLPVFTGFLGNDATVIGLRAGVPLRLGIATGAHVEGINRAPLAVPSLYQAQLSGRAPTW